MSISVNSIPKVSFKGEAEGTAAPAADILARPGKHASQPAQDEVLINHPPKKEKKSSFGKKLLKTFGVVALAAAALVGLAKGGLVKELETLEGAGFFKQVGHYLAKAGNAISKYTVDPIVKMLGKKSDPLTRDLDDLERELDSVLEEVTLVD
ncbi:hypothetical protein IJ579_00960 [bacterium]|nr:hypothetical protein [bacterium]